jgi:hypothetical protein
MSLKLRAKQRMGLLISPQASPFEKTALPIYCERTLRRLFSLLVPQRAAKPRC